MPAPAKNKTKTLPPPVERRERYTLMLDPPKRGDMLWSRLLGEAYGALASRYRRDPTTLVGGNAYMAREIGDWRTYQVFDCVVAFGVEAERIIREANAYVVSEAGKPPDFVLEIVTQHTQVRASAVNDYNIKRLFYRDVGAVEYWRFDASGGRFYDTPLAGDVLVDGEYRPIKIRCAEDGSLWGYSRALGLYLVVEEGRLRFFDPVRGEFLLTPLESMDEIEREIAENERRREETDRRIAADRAARIENERRIVADRAARIKAEAEIERLRRLLGDRE